MIAAPDRTGPPTVVVGAGGLLGRQVVLASRGVSMLRTIRWTDLTLASADIEESVRAMARADEGIRLVWCAGAGVVGTRLDALERELSLFELFLSALTTHSVQVRSLAYASSAGGVYAGSRLPVMNERSAVAPLADYGRLKLRHEVALTDWARQSSTPTVICRISNLYGPGQNMSKGQGLLSSLVRASLTRRPLPIFVPLDTRRDYLYAPDAARIFVEALKDAEGDPAQHDPLVRIVASGRSVTIGELVSEIGRIRKRKVPAVFARNRLSDLQPRSLVFDSLYPDTVRRTPLTVGLGAVIHEQLSLMQRGALA